MPEEFDYKRYLASREWAVLRERVRDRSGSFCERCHVLPQAAVHHLTYERVGHEELDDLLAVCVLCHAYLSAKSQFDPVAFVQSLIAPQKLSASLRLVADATRETGDPNQVTVLVLDALFKVREDSVWHRQQRVEAEKNLNQAYADLTRATDELQEAQLMAGLSVTRYAADGSEIVLSGEDGLAELRRILDR